MSKTSKTDLLVRVRYQNKLPPPPFPPRLLHLATTPHRYATYEFLNPLSSERELPMILDGELGMPLEMGKIAPGAFGDGEYWVGNRSAIVPAGPPPTPHDDDLLLLGDISSSAFASQSAPSTPGGSSFVGERKKAEVSWLRRTEYLSSDPGNKVTSGIGGASTIKPAPEALISLTLESRAKAISASFGLAHSPLGDLRHPSKPHLRAEISWDVLPDSQLWPNQLDLVRFGEDPGEVKTGSSARPSAAAADPRLPRAIFRPVEIPGEEGRIGYYLPQDEETAELYAKRRKEGADGVVDGEVFDFKYVRDYEIATTRELYHEYIFCFDDGDGEKAAKRPRGAYYATLNNAQTLRKRRPRRGEDPTVFPESVAEQGTVFWDGIAVQVRGLDAMGEADRLEREALTNEVEKPRLRGLEASTVV